MNGRRWTAFALAVCLLLAQGAQAARYAAVKLIAQEYAVEGGAIEAGETALLRVTLVNTNAYEPAGNIVLTVSDPQGKIIPQGPSGVYVAEIARGGREEVGFLLMAAPDAPPGFVKLTLDAQYETAEGQRESMQADLYVEIEQKMRLEHGAAALPDKATEGDNLAFGMEFFNMGKGTAYNVLMAFDVPGLNAGSAVLVGNIEPGESKTGRANLLVSSMDGLYGSTQGTLELTWENAAGERFAKVLALETVIAERKSVVRDEEEKKKEEESRFPAWAPGAAIALAGVGAVIRIQIGIERRRRRERDERLL
ncbi:MAG: hypothetical protein Q4A66_03955 [Eubacteriales bacterium]|nr:hypothetical protein [Eubacteriales bacterium]